MTLHFADGRPPHQLHEADRQQARDFIQATLVRDWSGYIHRLIDTGAIRSS